MKSAPGRFRTSWMVLVLAGLMIASMAFVGVTIYKLISNAYDERRWMSLATDVQVESQRLAKSASEAALGNLEAFGELASTRNKISADMRVLRTGSSADGLPPVPPEVGSQINELASAWTRVNANANSIVEREELIRELAAARSALLDSIPQIQAASDRMVRHLTESGAPSTQVFAASRQLILADRMLRRLTEIVQGGGAAVRASEDLREEIELFERFQRALSGGNTAMGITPVRNQQALGAMGEVRDHFEAARPHFGTILESSPELFEVRGAADEIFLDSREVFLDAGSLTEAVARLPRSRVWPSLQSAMVSLVVMIALVALLVGTFIASERRRADTAASNNRRTQKAILRLLDELGSLADGDLTVQATVKDDITGAIADAVNYAVEQLRELVSGINHTANAVAESAQNTRAATSQLADAAREQAGQVTRGSDKIRSMADALNSMAGRSHESSEAAMDSVKIAHAGAEKVRETIAGMDNIREQIQETSKRIKRLGESTQEIGDIVSLINDIAEQTNVLALNAAIQAASGGSGSGGKGFAMVADEVQQLAESATNATRRIESLVQTIQVDTAEAVASMEGTTSEVVSGAKLAEDAGQALLQIEEGSNELAGLIQEISSEAGRQSENATRISETMDGIREVSVKTSEGSAQMAEAVAELADLVMQLRESVADFKLPEAD